MAAEAPLIVILGPTASGKTAVAIELAKIIDGEIICADSRTVYKDMNIGTAKPTLEEMDGVPHHMLNLVSPGKRFTLWNFQQLAVKKIEDIRSRNRVPIMVGGSGLYIDSVVFNYDLGQVDRHDPERNKYDIFTVSDLQTMLKKQHIELPDNSLNRRHLIRALERGGINRSRLDRPVENTIIVGITTEKQIIQDRIRKRSIAMLDNGLAQEVRNLVEKYGQECEPIRRNLYGVIQEYLNGKIQTEGDLIQKMVIIDRRLAKKQLTWWRKNQFIEWMDSDEVISYIMDKTNLSK